LLEYAKEISTWHYSDLEAAIRKSSFRHLKPGETPARNLYDFVKDTPDVLDEKNFVDQVSRGLKRGRFLLLIVGDGIHEGLETLVEYVQLHGGMHFTIGLIDIAIFKGPTSGFLVLPRIVARTTNIDRGIVSIRDGEIIVEPPARSSDTSASPGRRTTITEDKFYEALAMANPLLPASLRSFMKELDDELHVETDFGQSSLVLRWRAGGDAKWNLGSVTTVGKLWTDMVDWQAKQIGRPDLSQRYHERLCSIVPGGRIKKYKSSQQVVTPDGLPDVYDLLRDIDKRRKWSAAIEEFIDDVNRNTEQT
jgi:hypothetical protein